MAAGNFVLVGVIGWPIAQSRSPIIHNAWIEDHRLNGRYVPLAVEPARLPDAMRGLRALGFRGCNVTMPHKLAVMPLLDHIDETAKRIGAVNAIVIADDGAMTGSNHDGAGYLNSLYEVAPNWKASAGPIALVGAGGGARALIVAMIDEGAEEIRLVNRTLDHAEALAKEFGTVVKPVSWDRRSDVIDDVTLLVNATNQGMTGKPALELSLERLPPEAIVSDLVYVPLVTPLLEAARKRGNVIVGGLGMLLHQARPAFASWFGVMPQITPQLRAAVEATFKV